MLDGERVTGGPEPEMLKGTLVALGNPGDDAMIVYPTPAKFTVRPENSARPAWACSEVAPAGPRVAPVGLTPSAREIVLVALVTVFPNASSTTTWMLPRICPAAAVDGWVTKERWVAPPPVTWKNALCAWTGLPNADV